MDCLTFLSEVVRALAWPIAIVVLGVKLKSSIHELSGRLTTAKHKETELAFSPKTQNTIATPAKADLSASIPKDSTGLLEEAEQKIYESLHKMKISSSEDKVKVLAKHHASLQIWSGFQQINHTIYGSQLKALRALNTQANPVERSFFESFYTEAFHKYPNQYANVSYDTWFNYLKSAGLINAENSCYFITQYGRGFLIALTDSGIEQDRIL